MLSRLTAVSRVAGASARVAVAARASTSRFFSSAAKDGAAPAADASAAAAPAAAAAAAAEPAVPAASAKPVDVEEYDDDLDLELAAGEEETFTDYFETNPLRVAVVLSGSGVYDGTEITEAASALIHLSANGCVTACFAPDKPQMHVVNHLTGEPVAGETRNVLVESARIARGAVAPLASLDATGFDALFFPGGFGAAKNLSTFATAGAALEVDPDVTKAVNAFLAAKKPLGLTCIAPVIAAKLVPGVTVTVGGENEGPEWPYAGAAAAIKQLGANHVATTIEEAYVDTEKNVVTGPAYMAGAASPHMVFDSVGRVVDAVITIAKEQVTARVEADAKTAAAAAEAAAAAAKAAAASSAPAAGPAAEAAAAEPVKASA